MSAFDPAVQARESRPSLARNALLACGIAFALTYSVVQDVVGALLYRGYDPFSQAVSELSSPGAPTKSAIFVVGLVSTLLMMGFGVGVVMSAKGNRALRAVGTLFVAGGALWPFWLLFPMSSRGEIQGATGLADLGHIVLSAITVLLIAAEITVGSFALGKTFRLYSLATLAAELGFAIWTFGYIPRVAAGQPTSWMGLLERASIGAWLLWTAVLAILLLRRHRGVVVGVFTPKPARA